MEENKPGEIKEFVYNAPIGHHLGLRGSAALAKTISIEKKLQNDEYLYRTGEKSDCFFMVASGKLALCVENAKSNRPRILHVNEAGDLVGELGFISEDSHRVSAQSVGESSVYVFGRKEIDELYEKHPYVMLDFLKAIIKRNHSALASVSRQKDEMTDYLASGSKAKL